MRPQFLLALPLAICGFALLARAQDDTPSLGDVARQSRQQKQQNDAARKPDNSPAAQPVVTQSNVATQSKDAQSKSRQAASAPVTKTPAATSKRIITDDEIPSHGGPANASQPGSQNSATSARSADNQENESAKPSAEAFTAQIRAMKENIASLQGEIDRISSSIQYTGANCVSGCAQWNDQQKRKQDEVDALKAQLEQAKQQLEQMQDSARQQGYGSSVYDP